MWAIQLRWKGKCHRKGFYRGSDHNLIFIGPPKLFNTRREAGECKATIKTPFLVARVVKVKVVECQ